MTREQFYKENCLMCGTLRCPGDDEAISTCGYYKGDIEGIEKQESLQEMLERVNKEAKLKGFLGKKDYSVWREG